MKDHCHQTHRSKNPYAQKCDLCIQQQVQGKCSKFRQFHIKQHFPLHKLEYTYTNSFSLHIKQRNFFPPNRNNSAIMSTMTGWHTSFKFLFKFPTNTSELPLLSTCQISEVKKLQCKLHKYFCHYPLICH